MRRNVIRAGIVMIVPALALFAWKVVGLGLPIVPSDPEGLWRVELDVRARSGGSSGSITAALPSTRVGQLLDDEQVTADRLQFSIKLDAEERTGLWKGSFSGVHELSHAFRLQLRPLVVTLPTGTIPPPPESIAREYGGASVALPSGDPEIGAFLLRQDLRGPEGPVGRARTLLTFVADEVELGPDGSDDALLCLAARECGPLGKERLLATLLRRTGTPARVIRGLQLRKPGGADPTAWVEAWLGGWVPLSASQGFFGRRPADLLAITAREGPLVRGFGVAAISHRYRAIPEQFHPDELAGLMVPASALLSPLSLYRLPVSTQRVLSLLLVIPLAALVLAVMRNVIGISTFGTFLPVLLALALRESDLLAGFAMLVAVVALGWVGRVLMDRLHLLLVPRLCIILCLVVLAVTALAMFGRGFEQRELLYGVLFPIVILTMLIERFSISVAEEGLRVSMVRLGWTIFVTVCVYPIFQSEHLAQIMFGYPELVLVVIGLLIWLGGYTGYRVSELIRFRSLATGGTGASS